MSAQELKDIYDFCQQNNVNVSFRFHGSKDDIPSYEIRIDDGKYSLIRKSGSWVDIFNEFMANNFGEGADDYE